MGVTTLTCYRLDCDGCGKPVTGEDDEGYGYAPHGETPDEVLGHLYGDPDVERDFNDGRLTLEGEQLGDGRILCGACNQKRLCAERGHRFGEWGRSWRCDCIPWDDCGHEERSCERNYCTAREERPKAVAVAS